MDVHQQLERAFDDELIALVEKLDSRRRFPFDREEGPKGKGKEGPDAGAPAEGAENAAATVASDLTGTPHRLWKAKYLSAESLKNALRGFKVSEDDKGLASQYCSKEQALPKNVWECFSPKRKGKKELTNEGEIKDAGGQTSEEKKLSGEAKQKKNVHSQKQRQIRGV